MVNEGSKSLSNPILAIANYPLLVQKMLCSVAVVVQLLQSLGVSAMH